MANPAIQPFSNAAAAAKAGTQHAIGLRHALIGDSNTTDPNWLSKYITFFERMWDLLLKACGGVVAQFVSTGLTVDVYAADYRIGSTRYSYAGGTLPLTATSTNYVYLDADQVPKTSTSAFPANVFRLAIVTTDGAAVTSTKDARHENFRIGETEWWNVAAGANVNLAGFDILNAGRISFEAPTTVTIAADTITPTNPVHNVDTEGGAAADDLTTITADATNWPRLLILRNANAARLVTIKAGGNIDLAPQGDLRLISTTSHVLLLQYSATRWINLGRPDTQITTLLNSIQGANFSLISMGSMSCTVAPKTIASDLIDAVDRQFIKVDTEAGAAADNVTVTVSTPATAGAAAWLNENGRWKR